ncbi:hypothetical protein JCM15519_26320 [Fundidesulfovibrio butyratiphilus]
MNDLRKIAWDGARRSRTAAVFGRARPVFLACLLAWAVFCACAAFASTVGHGLQGQDLPRSITVVLDDNYPPYVFRNDKGELQGILVDEWRLWEARTGVRVKLEATNWDKVQRIMAAGEADVIDTLFKTPEREALYDFSKPYVTLEVPIFFHKDISGLRDTSSLKGFTVGVKTGDSGVNVLKAQGVTTVQEYDSYAEVIEAAARHDIRVFLIDRPPALYYLYKRNLADEFRVGFVLYSGQFHRAVRKGRAALLDLVETGFERISPREREAIENRWMGAPVANPTVLRRFLYAGVGFAFVVVALVIFNATLRRRVRQKTAQLANLVEDLGRSEAQFRLLVTFMPVPIVLSSPEGQAVFINERFLSLFGYAKEEVDTMEKWLERAFPDPARRAAQLETIRKNKLLLQSDRAHTQLDELRVACKDGSLSVVEVHGTMLGENELLVFIDVTERKRAEDDLRRQEEYFRLLIETSPLSMAVVDLRDRSTRANAKFTEILGYTPDEVDTLDKWWENVHPDPQTREECMGMFREQLAASRNGSNPIPSFEAEVTAKDGMTKTIEFHLSRIGELVMVMFVDLTERKRMQEMLIQTEKMVTVAGLAAGMAHEINNPLSGILQSSQVVLRRLTSDSPINRQAAQKAGFSFESLQDYLRMREVVSMVESVRTAAMRAAQIVSSMLDLSRSNESVGAPADMNKLLDKSVELCSTDYDLKKKYDFRHVSIERDYDLSLPQVQCSPIQMQQVFMNLLKNSAQAMAEASQPDGVPRKILLRTRNLAGEKVRVEVRDNGPGMTETIRRKVFEPFFTTKPPGVGTGLGLSVSYFIITNGHKGAITVESAPGKGAGFIIELPVKRR